MCRFLFFWILLVTVSGVHSQNVHFAYHSVNDRTGNVVCINDKTYFLERVDLGSGDSCNLVALDENGAVLFKYSFWASQTIQRVPVKLKVSSDKKLLVLFHGYRGSCDARYFSNYYFSKLDTLGNQIFQVSVLSNSVNPFYEPYGSTPTMDFTEYSDSSFFFSVNNELYHFSKTGHFISKKILSLNGIGALGVFSNGHLFLNGALQGTTTTVAETDTSGNILQSMLWPIRIQKFYQNVTGDLFMLGYDGYLFRCTPQFSIIMQTGGPFGKRYADFILNSDTLYAISCENGSKLVYDILDTGLNLIHEDTIQSFYMNPTGIWLDRRNRIHLTATGSNIHVPSLYPGGIRMSFRNYFQFGKFLTFPNLPDVGVVSIKFLDAQNVNMQEFYLNAEVEVKNYGTQPVHGFNLVSTKFLYYCLSYYRQWIDTIIPPGSSIKVVTGWQNLRGESWSGIYFNNKRNICFYTSTPNHFADKNPANDRFCDSVSVLPTGIETYNSIDNQVQVFPNPFSSNIYIQSQVDIKEIKVFNALSILVYKQIVNSKEIELGLQDIEQGIYFVRIETEKGVVTKKLIKE